MQLTTCQMIVNSNGLLARGFQRRKAQAEEWKFDAIDFFINWAVDRTRFKAS